MVLAVRAWLRRELSEMEASVSQQMKTTAPFLAKPLGAYGQGPSECLISVASLPEAARVLDEFAEEGVQVSAKLPCLPTSVFCGFHH